MGGVLSMLTLSLLLITAAVDGGTLLTRPLSVTADSLEVLGQERRAVYSGNAKVVRDTTTLTCQSLTVHYNAKREVERIDAHGAIEAKDGERWATGEEATYDNTTGVLVVTGKPQARQGPRHVAGDEVRFTTGSEKLEVKNARTVVEGERNMKRVEIDADQLRMESPKHRATWSGHVKAKRDGTTLKAPLLIAQYDESGAVTQIEARGGIEVTDRDKWAKGQRADFNNQTGVLVVTGKPEARQGNNRMKGSKVTFISGSDRLEVDNATTVIEASPKGKR